MARPRSLCEQSAQDLEAAAGNNSRILRQVTLGHDFEV